MINRTVLVGRLTKDLELKYTAGGIAYVRFTLAVNRSFTNQQGVREADFVNCVAWRKQAENMCEYLSKGSLIGIDGRIQTSNFEGKDGKRVFMTEVVSESVQFLESRRSSQNRNNSQYNQHNNGHQEQNNYQSNSHQQQNQESHNPFDNNAAGEISDDDLPF